MTPPAASAVAIVFGAICLFAFMAMKSQAEQVRGERRFYLIGFYRSVLLAFGVVSLMIGISRLLAAFSG